ncbi:MAG: cytidine deaminase [Oscillospiraceae bacterium]|jgi:cytidine deaminase|nr:cytidine deaminase [Oscillospiraceae bacterium]
MTKQELVSKAKAASQNAYAPYSHFRVGAALECGDGSVYTGCNVENAAYGLAICAERTAMVKAVSEGRRDFVRLGIYCADTEDFGMPCGQCRQFMAEFNLDMEVIIGRPDGETQTYLVRDLLPQAFTPADLP